MNLTLDGIKEKQQWERANIRLPEYDVRTVRKRTAENPEWVHFGAGNIFRGFIGSIAQKLLNSGSSDTGIIAVETFDFDIIDKIYEPYDSLTLNVMMDRNSNLDMEVLGGVTEGIKANNYARLSDIAKSPSLKMISYTITEKGYNIYSPNDDFMDIVKTDIENGLKEPKHAMSVTAYMLYERFKAGKYPLAVVSMDNCSHNGEKLQKSVITSKNTYIAPFVNAEIPQYLVVEDSFPNGRPSLQEAGVYMTTRETVNESETMKVTTCLNPLHTALAVFGCLLGYDAIWAEMQDSELKKLVNMIADEGMKVVINPEIINPQEFVKEVIEERSPNPNIPDAPQRIATDTSQKVGIRYGETIKACMKSDSLDISELKAIPMAIAGWLRYLIGVDDSGKEFERSSDPRLDELSGKLSGVTLGNPDSINGKLKDILSDKSIFGVDLYEAGLVDKIESNLKAMLKGTGAIRNTLKNI